MAPPPSHVLHAIVAVVVLLGSIASFKGFKHSAKPDEKRPHSPITGFPIWHLNLDERVKEINATFVLMAFIFCSISAYAGYKATRLRSMTGIVSFSNLTGGSIKEVTSTQFNTFILYYIYATYLAIIGYAIFDIGKLWSVVGGMHNLLEVALLCGLHAGGQVTNMYFAVSMFIYVFLVVVVSIYLPWPFDAIFFRWQGLCSDYALIIMFWRIYRTTENKLKEFGGPDAHDRKVAAAQHTVNRTQTHRIASVANILDNPLPRHESVDTISSQEDPLLPSNSNTSTTTINSNQNESLDLEGPVWSRPIIHNPCQLWFLIAAAVIHVLGNDIATIFSLDPYANGFFLASYGVTFPLYAYYLYVDSHSLRQTKIYLPEFSTLKNITVACFSIALATLTLRLGLYVTERVKNGGL